MSYSNTWLDRGLIRTFSGTVDGEEILESNFALHAHPKFESVEFVINDFTQVSEILINESHTRAFSSVDKNLSLRKPDLKIALVINRPEHMPLAIHYRQLMLDSSFECEIFDRLDDARAWAEFR